VAEFNHKAIEICKIKKKRLEK